MTLIAWSGQEGLAMNLRGLIFTFFFLVIIILAQSEELLRANGMESDDFDRMDSGLRMVKMRYTIDDDAADIGSDAMDELLDDVESDMGLGSGVDVVFE